MIIMKGNEYEPQSLNDIIFGNYESKCRIYDIVTCAEDIPASGKSAILLYGTYGTGKTTLAKMLPDAIENGKVGQGLNIDPEFIACQQGFNGPQVMTLIENIISRVAINASNLHYIILDEVDNLSKLAQQSLKSALNTKHAIFILTTNHISDLDRGLLDRCILVEMNAANNNQLLPLARQIAKDMNVDISDQELLPIINAANGSFRNITHNIERFIRRKNMPSNIIF